MGCLTPEPEEHLLDNGPLSSIVRDCIEEILEEEPDCPVFQAQMFMLWCLLQIYGADYEPWQVPPKI